MFEFLPDSTVHADKKCSKVGELTAPSREAHRAVGSHASNLVTGPFYTELTAALLCPLPTQGGDCHCVHIDSTRFAFQQMHTDHTQSLVRTIPRHLVVIFTHAPSRMSFSNLTCHTTKLSSPESQLCALRQAESWEVMGYSLPS